MGNPLFLIRADFARSSRSRFFTATAFSRIAWFHAFPTLKSASELTRCGIALCLACVAQLAFASLSPIENDFYAIA